VQKTLGMLGIPDRLKDAKADGNWLSLNCAFANSDLAFQGNICFRVIFTASISWTSLNPAKAKVG
jgi:hypothetical protein